MPGSWLTHLNGDPPDGLHGEGDEAGDAVCYGEVVHKVVDISSTPEYKI